METLIDRVLEQITNDVKCQDLTAIECLLQYVSPKILINYLPEEMWKEFEHLQK